MSSIRASGSIWNPNVPRQLAHARARGVVVEEALVARLDPEHDVLGDRHHRNEHEVLVHHADPALDRVLRRAERDALAVEDDLALVGLREPVEDVHQRRLAGAVLAEQRVHLAAAEVEVDVVVGDGAGEDLRDSPQLEDRRRFLRHRGDSTGVGVTHPREPTSLELDDRLDLDPARARSACRSRPSSGRTPSGPSG